MQSVNRFLTLCLMVIGVVASTCSTDTSIVCAQDSKGSSQDLTALTAADDARVAAVLAANREKLEELLADDLHYAHSSGSVDTKKSFIEALTSGKSKYVGLDYIKREFKFPTPGIALMTGQVHILVNSGESKVDANLSYLGVWQQQNGKWRFLAWQSCRLPVPEKPAAK